MSGLPRPAEATVAGPASRVRGPAAEVLRQWRDEAVAVVGLPATTWDVAACIDLVHAALGNAELLPAVRRFANQRALLGATLEETTADLDVLAGLDPVLRTILDRAEVGVALALGHRVADTDSCTDPLTGLANRSYLAVRLREVQRQAARRGLHPSETAHLLVLRLPPPSSLSHSLSRAITVGDELRRHFPDDDVIVSLSSRTFAVLRSGPETSPALDWLEAGADTWVELVPDVETDIPKLLTALA